MKLKSIMMLFLFIVAYLATGVYQVQPGEWAVVRRFGQPLKELSGSGLHWGLPWGLDRVDRLAVDEQRQLQIGVLEEQGPGDSLAPVIQASPTGQILTGDNQIVNLRISLLYRLDRDNLIDYVLMRDRAEEIVTKAVEESLTSTLASEKIDTVLLGRSLHLETRLRDCISERLKRYQLGIVIDSVNLVYAQPPAELIEIFRDVNRARSQRDISLTEAVSRKDADISQARRETASVFSQAKANAQAKLAVARSEADSFRAIFSRFPTSEPGISSALLQLYLTEMQSIVSRMQVRTLSDQGMEQVVVVPLPAR